MKTNSELRNRNFDESSSRQPSSSLFLNDVSPIGANREYFSGIDTSCIPPDFDIFQIDPRELFFYMDTLSTQLSVTSIGDQQLNRDLINSLQNDKSIRFVNHNEFDRSIDSTLPMDWIQPVQNHAQTADMMEIGDSNQTSYTIEQRPEIVYQPNRDKTQTGYSEGTASSQNSSFSNSKSKSKSKSPRAANQNKKKSERKVNIKTTKANTNKKQPLVHKYLIDLIENPSKYGSFGWIKWVNKQAGMFEVLKTKLVAKKFSEIKGNITSTWKNFKRGVRSRIGEDEKAEFEFVGEENDYRITFNLRIRTQYGWMQQDNN